MDKKLNTFFGILLTFFLIQCRISFISAQGTLDLLQAQIIDSPNTYLHLAGQVFQKEAYKRCKVMFPFVSTPTQVKPTIFSNFSLIEWI